MSIMKDVVRDGDEITAVLYSGSSKSEADIVFKYVSSFLKNTGCIPIEALGIDRLLKVKNVMVEDPEHAIDSEKKYKIAVTGTLLPDGKRVWITLGRGNGRTFSLELIKNMKLKGEQHAT